MSKSLSIANVIEKNRIASATPFLILIDVGVIDPNTGTLIETLRLVRNNEDIVFQGNTYTAANFDLELKAESGAQHNLTLSVRDLTLTVQARMQAYGGGIGFTVTLMVVNAGNLAQPAEIVEYFEIIGASADASTYTASFTLGTENSVMQSFPRRKQTVDFCQWRYKGAECGYSGFMPTCDLSLQGPNGCAVHGNTVRFGGFPGLSSRNRIRG